ncbi:MAG: TonB-dependent receptor [Sphingobacteriaceae bacterium]|nr:TonB-dependent receptor [Sphingobacteriaceae bacterium]
MKRYLIFLLFLPVSLLYSQVNLSGTIKNKQNNEAIPGVVVYFPDLKMGITSSSQGHYKFEKLPKIKTLVQFKMIGFKTIVKSIALDTNTVLNIDMEESVLEEEEIVVTGHNHATESKTSPVPMVNISSRVLQQNSYNNIIEALNKVPGLSSVNSGPNISKPFIRGLGMNRVLTLFDGVRQEGQQWGEEHGVEIDQFLIDRIEVVKGPASLIYGSDALAGVINLLPANPQPEGSTKGSLLSAYHSNNKQYTGSFSFAGSEGALIYGGRISKKKAGNYTNKVDGKVYGTKFDESDLNLYAGFNKNWGYTHFNFSYYENKQEVPSGDRDSSSRKFVKSLSEEDTLLHLIDKEELNSYKLEGAQQHIKHLRLFATSGFHLGRSRLVSKFGVQQSSRKEFHNASELDHPELNMLLNTITYDLKFHFPEIKGIDADIGINGFYQENKNEHAHEFVIPDYYLFDFGPFLYVRKNFGKLDITGGIRTDQRSFYNTGLYTREDSVSGLVYPVAENKQDSTIIEQFPNYRANFSGVSAGIGLTYNFSEHLGLKTNIARGYRAPNISEIASKGVHTGTGLLQLGNKELIPEFSLQQDLGIFFETEHISGELDLFHNLISNYIYNEKLSSAFGGDSLAEKGNDFVPVYRFNQTKAQLYGAEFSFDIHPHPFDWLHIENAVSFISAQNLGGNGVKVTDSTKYLPLIPPFRTVTEIRADLKKKIACFKNTYVKTGFQYYAEQNKIYSAFGTETKTPSYFLLDAGIGTDVVNKNNRVLFSLSVNVNNLADEIYQSNMSRLKYFDNYPVNGSGRSGIYNMGRDINFKLIIPLSIKSN